MDKFIVWGNAKLPNFSIVSIVGIIVMVHNSLFVGIAIAGKSIVYSDAGLLYNVFVLQNEMVHRFVGGCCMGIFFIFHYYNRRRSRRNFFRF